MRAWPIRSAKSALRLRPDVQPEPALGKSIDLDNTRLGITIEAGGGDHVHWKKHLPGRLELGAQGAPSSNFFCHLASDEERVGKLRQPPEHPDLVVDLGAAGDRDVGPLGLLDEAPELLQLALEQKAGVGRQQVRDGLRRGVGPVRRAERVVHVDVQVVGELAREGRIVRRLARVEARVLEQPYARVGLELAQPFGNRRDAKRRILALRPAEVRAEHDLRGAALEQQPDRGERRPDARVVGDPRVLERDVEVDPDEDALAGDVGGANGTRTVHFRVPVGLRAGYRTAGSRRGRTYPAPTGAFRPDPPACCYSPTRCRTRRRPSPRGRGPS